NVTLLQGFIIVGLMGVYVMLAIVTGLRVSDGHDTPFLLQVSICAGLLAIPWYLAFSLAGPDGATSLRRFVKSLFKLNVPSSPDGS
ncbi:MAG: hypothetical protein AAF497_13120, partial [Planctomycetota bacterium]